MIYTNQFIREFEEEVNNLLQRAAYEDQEILTCEQERELEELELEEDKMREMWRT